MKSAETWIGLTFGAEARGGGKKAQRQMKTIYRDRNAQTQQYVQ